MPVIFPIPSAKSEVKLVAAGLAVALLAGAIAGSWHFSSRMRAGASRARPPAKPSRVPVAPPLLLRDVDRQTAIEINRTIAFSKEPNPPSRPFVTKGDDLAYVRALDCLTATIYYEAANETLDGQRAVAQVVLNRVRHPAFPKSVCAVTYQGSRRRTGCQFSFTCDGALLRKPITAIWAQARAVAVAALDGAVFAPVGYASHYHANYVVPYWAPNLAKNAVVGTHLFYRWPGWWGQPTAFRRKHSGQEPDPRVLRHLALGLSGKPQLDDPLVDVDPRVELLSIVDLLAASARDEEEEEEDVSEYHKKVREHFSDYSNHIAVEIYRQLRASGGAFQFESALSAIMQYSALPDLEEQGTVGPEIIEAAGGREALDGFIASLRDFVDHTHFENFFADQRTFYAERNETSRTLAIDLLANVERKTANRIGNVNFVQSSSLHEIASSGCMPFAPENRKRWLVIPASVGKNPSRELSALAETLISLSKSPCKSSRRPRSK